MNVSLTTHSGDLGGDMAKVSFLRDNVGVKYAPIGWQGDPPGGHHREGILEFKPLLPLPDKLTLVIKNVGGVTERSFDLPINN